jgi:hypothetical protein
MAAAMGGVLILVRRVDLRLPVGFGVVEPHALLQGAGPDGSAPSAKRPPVPPGRGTAEGADVYVVANSDHPNRGRAAVSAIFLIGRDMYRLCGVDGIEFVGPPTGRQ